MNTFIKDKEATKIIKASYKTDYTISFIFNNGEKRDVDFYSFLSKPFQHQDVKKYLDIKLFKNFKITPHQDIEWNDYEMCFPFDSIYSGKL